MASAGAGPSGGAGPAATAAATAVPAAPTAPAAAASNTAGSIATSGASVSSKDMKAVNGNDSKSTMANVLKTEGEDDDKDWDAALSNYSAAPRMSVADIMAKDKEDKSLEKYKKQLLGDAAANPSNTAVKPNDPRHCIVESISLLFAGQPPIVLDPNDKNLKTNPFVLKEGQNFKTVIKFLIQHEIVSGLRYQNKIYKHHFRVDNRQDMLGSFAPQMKAYEITMPEDTTPSGWSGRGAYTAKCKIVDDDKTQHCRFEYSFVIKPDWK